MLIISSSIAKIAGNRAVHSQNELLPLRDSEKTLSNIGEAVKNATVGPLLV